MRFSCSVIILATCSITSASAQQPWPPSPHVASTPPLTPAEQRKKFHLPPGFDIELVAAEPDINKPINIAFDARGRLWVTGSVEYPFAAKEGKGRDKVWILGDFAADGNLRTSNSCSCSKSSSYSYSSFYSFSRFSLKNHPSVQG